MGGFAMGLIGAAPSALRVIYLVAWRRRFGRLGWVCVALVLIEAVAFAPGSVFVHGTAFVAGTVFVHGTVFVRRTASETGLAGHRRDRRPASNTRNLSRRGEPGRGSAFPAEW